jgi:hypothetical protein
MTNTCTGPKQPLELEIRLQWERIPIGGPVSWVFFTPGRAVLCYPDCRVATPLKVANRVGPGSCNTGPALDHDDRVVILMSVAGVALIRHNQPHMLVTASVSQLTGALH